jgi:hypothetical protein
MRAFAWSDRPAPAAQSLFFSPVDFMRAFAWNDRPAPAPQSLFFSPVAAWWGMSPWRGSPAGWPMAFALMAIGVPSSVAWPTAEANLATLEAAEAATASINNVFSSYRSESGYAVVQLMPPRKLLMALLLGPLAASALLPWTLSWSGPGY